MRNDCRKNDELRPIKFTHDFTKHALGSVLVEFGDTKVIVTASVEKKKPRWMAEEDNRGWVTAEYSLLPSSTSTRCQRERTKISGRTQEIQRLIGRSLRAAVDLGKIKYFDEKFALFNVDYFRKTFRINDYKCRFWELSSFMSVQCTFKIKKISQRLIKEIV